MSFCGSIRDAALKSRHGYLVAPCFTNFNIIKDMNMNAMNPTTAENTQASHILAESAPMTEAQKKIKALKDLATTYVPSTLPTLEQFRIGESVTPCLPFTPDHEKVAVHWMDTQEKKGYVQCNDDGCVLCATGNKFYIRILLAMLNFNSQKVEVLAISGDCNPGAALPQILPVFDRTELTMMLISRQRNKFTIDLRSLPENVDAGQEKIEAFNTAYTNGDLKLSSIFEKCTNEELAAIPSIKMLLQCYGITAE